MYYCLVDINLVSLISTLKKKGISNLFIFKISFILIYYYIIKEKTDKIRFGSPSLYIFLIICNSYDILNYEIILYILKYGVSNKNKLR